MAQQISPDAYRVMHQPGINFVDDDIPYLLLTPGPLTTSRTVKQVMLQDYCTWDDDYNDIVNDIRHQIVRLATLSDDFTSVLMQGSGTFAVEATIGSVVPPRGKVLVVNNGAYGDRIVQICNRLQIECVDIKQPETEFADLDRIEGELRAGGISHIACVHCETTTGLLNPVFELGSLAKKYNVRFIVDAMSSFGGMPMTMEALNADFLISSANKCIQGVPGFGFVIANRNRLEESAGHARSLSLDLFDQWKEMEEKNGKWRYTSPTHVVRAFAQALSELRDEGGVPARYDRYSQNQILLTAGLRKLGFRPLIQDEHHSPIITAFHFPRDDRFTFLQLYHELKRRRFVIYPGKVSNAETFRVGTIGHVFREDILELVACFQEVVQQHDWKI